MTTSSSVLIVDDHPANLVAMEATLEPLGRRIVQASSGQEALRHVLQENFACIVMDVQMPELDGIETSRLIQDRERERGRQIPILLVTALDRDDAQLVHGYGAGVVDYLVKPYKPEILRAKVRLFIELHEREQRVREREARLHAADVERAHAETRAERQQLHDIFLQAPVAICIFEGPKHRFTFANPAYLTLIGNANVIGKPFLEALPGLAGQGFDRLLDQVMASGVPFVGQEVEVKLAHHGEGEVDYLNFVYQPRRNVQGEVTGVMVCAFEFTEQVLARRRAETAAEARARAIATRDDFLAIAGHELKTPLAALLMHIQSIQRALAANLPLLKLDERLEQASSSGVRLANLIDQMLDVTRITAGRLRLDLETFFLDDLVRDVVERFAEPAERAGAPMTLRCDARVQGAWDRTRIEEVLSNLLGNAVKYGQGKPIDVELVSGEAEVVIRVVDRGIGIESDQQRWIFERFERAGKTREFGGFGLGLWLSRQIVEASGGRIQVDSAPGQGATFSVWLPRRLQEAQRAAAE